MPRGHLTSEERYAIEQLLLYGCSQREIGRRLGRHHSVIGREVARNGPLNYGVYIGGMARWRSAGPANAGAGHASNRSNMSLIMLSQRRGAVHGRPPNRRKWCRRPNRH